MGMISCGHADITMMQSISARKTMLSPGFDVGSRHSRSPAAWTGMFIHKLNDAGQGGGVRLSAVKARCKLLAQLSWNPTHPSFASRAGSQAAITRAGTPHEVSD